MNSQNEREHADVMASGDFRDRSDKIEIDRNFC